MNSEDLKIRFNIVEEILIDNNHLDATLTGSLMLYLLGIDIIKDNSDIDIIISSEVEDPNSEYYENDFHIWLSDNFRLLDKSGRGSNMESLKYLHIPTNIKIDF